MPKRTRKASSEWGRLKKTLANREKEKGPSGRRVRYEAVL
jgi:hypothetical protein